MHDGGAGDSPRFVIVGRVRRPHGVRGDLVVEPMTSDPDVVLAAGRSVWGGTRNGDAKPGAPELHVETARPFQDALLMHFAEIADHAAAERWRDRYLLAPEADLVPPSGDEIYLHDLVGLAVESHAGESLGTVIAFYELSQGLMLEVERERHTFLLPYRDEFIDHLDRGRGTIVVRLPEGFFE